LFQPPFCPHADCPTSTEGAPFRFHRHGRYRPACDGAWIQRFRCLVCERAFGTQTFKSNYRYRIPFLHHLLIPALCSKVTRRQAARIFEVNQKTVERRFVRMAEVSADFHRAQLQGRGVRGVPLSGPLRNQAQTNRATKRLARKYVISPSRNTLAKMRDGMSCLVWGNWAACKTKRGLERHTAIWAANRNYVRSLTNKTKTTPAQAAGVCAQRWSQRDLLRWRWPSRMLAMETDPQAGQIPGGSSNQPLNSGPVAASPSVGTGTCRRRTKISSRPSPSKSRATKLCGEVQPSGS
jgi:transposase-like protein